MTYRVASKRSLSLIAGVFTLGLATSSGFGHLLTSLVPSAEANPGKNGMCNAASMRGKYGISYRGTIPGVGDFVGVGQEVCDDDGSCVGTATDNIAGVVVNSSFTSEATINPDCTGFGTVTYANGAVAQSAFVIVDGGDEVHFMGRDPQLTLLGVQKRR